MPQQLVPGGSVQRPSLEVVEGIVDLERRSRSGCKVDRRVDPLRLSFKGLKLQQRSCKAWKMVDRTEYL
jgi:hypothetical protein